MAASFLLVAALLSIPTTIHAQTPESYAQLRFARGRELFAEGRYEAALGEFRDSLSLSPSPNSRLYIARCLRELGRNGEAVAELILTAAEALDRASTDPRYHDTATAAQSELEELRERVGWLTIQIEDPPQGLRLSISGRAVPAEALGVPIPVDPGSLSIVAAAEGFSEIRQELTLDAGERRDLLLDLAPLVVPDETVDERREPEPAPPRAPPPRRRPGLAIGSGIGFGFACIGAALTGVFGVMALSRRDELQQWCEGELCPPEYDDELQQGRLYQALANVGIAIGAAGLTVGTILLILTLRHRRDIGGGARVHFMGNGWGVSW